MSFNRRTFLKRGGLGVVPATIAFSTDVIASSYGPLQAPDSNGLMLPPGFSSRVLAVSNETTATTNHVWHRAPDGGAVFPSNDGGWIYVSNSERGSSNGGVGAIRFDSDGEIVDAYSILSGTNYNCAGGPTPWGTWLSCEEFGSGEVWECDPYTPGSQGIVRPQMGRFYHEAAAVDPINQCVYLTEDRSNGLLYRFRPTNYPDLSVGILEAAEVLDPSNSGPIQTGETRALIWHVVADPSVTQNVPTREQVATATAFKGGEGIWYQNGAAYFATKNDNRVWKLITATQQLSIIYDFATSDMPVLSGVDNVFVAPNGDVLVAEDPGDLQLVAIRPDGAVEVVLQLMGSGTEITGPAMSPDGTRLYFSSQRNPGTTFEVSGPFIRSGTTLKQIPVISTVGGICLAAATMGIGLISKRRRSIRIDD